MTTTEPTTTNAVQTWSGTDKSKWGAGEWQAEPDKVQWVDAATNLDCLAVRGPHGGWCGYVGVAEGHPYFNVGYSACPQACGESWCGHSPESRVEVHGGLTFADFCADASRELFEKWQAMMTASEAEALRYPRGDAAERLRTLGHLRNDYDGWLLHHEAHAICHVARPGRPERVWWLGFDCAHSGDLSPKYDSETRRFSPERYDTYRTLAYVQAECTKLAQQLAATPSPTPEAPADAR